MAGNKHDEHDLPVPDLELPEHRHETSDVDTWAVGKVGIALVLVCIASLAMLVGLFRYFASREEAQNPPSAMSLGAGRRPPQPQLEETPVRDLQRMRQAEDQALHSYGWVDGPNGIVRIPIDRAIDMLVARGLPARSQAGPQSAAAGVSVPTESGLGGKQ